MTMPLAARLARAVARFTERRADWSVFGFETARDPRFARIQRRYIGASGSVDPNDLRGGLPATAFTLSVQTVPVGNMIPMHCHEVEEVFFILEGQCTVRCFADGEVSDLSLGRWDLVKLPVGLQHELHNTGDVDCHVQTLLSAPQPRRPQYDDPALLELQRAAEAPVVA
jgi:mannose-6-phosphate isomerase-like protein (cupin superfamily)